MVGQALVVLEPGDVGAWLPLHGAGHAALAAQGQQVGAEAHQEARLLAQVGLPVARGPRHDLVCGGKQKVREPEGRWGAVGGKLLVEVGVPGFSDISPANLTPRLLHSFFFFIL